MAKRAQRNPSVIGVPERFLKKIRPLVGELRDCDRPWPRGGSGLARESGVSSTSSLNDHPHSGASPLPQDCR
ncbi:hypothetical protein FHG55_15060 [Pseudomonas jessenii]|uniref:Uncharacterized protein n=1 Tax=Pseudomonas jessenii TaxID=77298 RepID=A0A5C4KV39_PSEJE|nr:hypothetical protein FHG55_15060 [Pseudomonas jessenii]